MIPYDPSIVQQMADRLYGQANAIIIKWTLGVALVAFFAAALLQGIFQANVDSAMKTSLLIAAVFAAIGFGIGKSKVFLIKLEAQKLLLLLEIEKNTRTRQAS